MEFKWGLENLKKDCDTLAELIALEKDESKAFYLKEMLDNLNLYIYEEYSNVKFPKKSVKFAFHEAMASYISCNRYYNLVSSFYIDVNKYHEILKKISDKITLLIGNNRDFSFLTGANFSTKKAIYLTDYFYSTFDKELYSVYKEASVDRENRLTFKKHVKGKNPATERDAYSFFVRGLRKNYVAVDRSSSLEKIINLTHEYGHAIANLINPSYQSSISGIFHELSAMFPEFILLFENKLNFSDLEINHWLFSFLTSYYECANYLTVHSLIYKCFEENNFKYNLNFFIKLYRDYGIHYNYFKDAIAYDILDSGDYILSFEAGLELVYIYYYENKKEKALDIYKKILKIDTSENEFKTVISLLPLGEHTDFMIKEILKRMRKSLTEVMQDEKLGCKLHKKFKK